MEVKKQHGYFWLANDMTDKRYKTGTPITENIDAYLESNQINRFGVHHLRVCE